jgi:hypothetical protein
MHACMHYLKSLPFATLTVFIWQPTYAYQTFRIELDESFNHGRIESYCVPSSDPILTCRTQQRSTNEDPQNE